MSRVLIGSPGAPGMRVGRSVLHDPRLRSASAQPRGDSRVRLKLALQRADSDLEMLQERVAFGDEAAILGFQRDLLCDPELMMRIDASIDRLGVEAAVSEALEHYGALLISLDDPILRERAADLRDVEQRLLRALAGEARVSTFDQPVVLVAQQLLPSELAAIDGTMLTGVCLAGAGPSSHVVILARALGVPVVLFDATTLREIPLDVRLLVDGLHGRVVIDPNDVEVAVANGSKVSGVDHERLKQGVRVTAVVGSLAEAQAARDRGVAGIGLLRTEFLFADSRSTAAPSVAEQIAAYRAVAECFPDQPITIRLFDAGGDKPLPYLSAGREANPALGMRGVRLLLEHPGLMCDQIAAIAALADARIRVLVPMVTDIGELLRAREIFDAVCGGLVDQARPKFGAMIEVPAAALMADVLIEHVDFFSIGTNDLAQFTLAADRDGARYAAYGDALHPAVLKLIEMTVSAAHAHGKPVSVCGEAAGRAAAALIALGVDELAVGI
jgi:phosphoenolpyruvate-protein phosphotransferase